MNSELHRKKTRKVILVLMLFAGWTILATRCTSKSTRDFTTLDLLVPLEQMPAGMEISGKPGPMGPSGGLHFGDSDDSYVSFKPVSSKYIVADHFVLEFKNGQKAGDWYEHTLPSEFNSDSIAVDEPWHTPQELMSFNSQTAAQFHVACTINNIAGRKQVCQLMAQYEEFVVIFSSVISQEAMMIEQFADVINEIDQIMFTHLQEY